MATRGKKTSVHTCAKNHIPKKVIMIMSVVITAFNRKAVRLVGYIYGGVFIFGFFFVSFLDFFCFSWLLASGFCGFWLLWLSGFCGFWLSWLSWLLWLLAFVAFGFLAYPSICLYLSIYLSNFLSFFLLAAVLLSLFVFAFPVVFVAETKPNKEASKQANKQARAAHLWIWCAAGGSALHPRHPRLPRNQYFKVNSPVQNFLTKQICLLYLSIYLSIYPILSYLI